MKATTKDWLNAADDDLLAIESLISNTELTNIVAFHSQQVIEKSFKAVFEEFEIILIRTHNLETLFTTVKTKIRLEANRQIIAELDRLYLDARYPGDFGLMPYGKPSVAEAERYYCEAKKIRKDVEFLLPI